MTTATEKPKGGRGKRREWTPEQIALMKSGKHSQQELANMFGVSRTTVQNAMKYLGIPLKIRTAPAGILVAARIPPDVLKTVDKRAKRMKMTRTQAIVQALEAWTR